MAQLRERTEQDELREGVVLRLLLGEIESLHSSRIIRDASGRIVFAIFIALEMIVPRGGLSEASAMALSVVPILFGCLWMAANLRVSLESSIITESLLQNYHRDPLVDSYIRIAHFRREGAQGAIVHRLGFGEPLLWIFGLLMTLVLS
jgi:hypothetical protein